MDTVTLVESRVDAGEQLLDQLEEKGFAISAACWLKPVDEDRWSLYIATPSVEEKGTLGAYRQLTPVLLSLSDSWLTGSDVTLVGARHPIVHDALETLRRFPHRTPIRPPRTTFGGMSVEEVFVYPLSKTRVMIYGLIYRGDSSRALHLAFEPHNPNTKLTVDGTEFPAVTGIDWVVSAPDGAKLEPNEIGQVCLTWIFHGERMQSTANEIWSLAKLGLHGFRILREPLLADDSIDRS